MSHALFELLLSVGSFFAGIGATVVYYRVRGGVVVAQRGESDGPQG